MGEERRRGAEAAVAGALGGLALAVADLVPSVLWLPELPDRLALVARLLAILGGLGALLALAAAGLDRLLARASRGSRHPRLARTLGWLAVLTPAIAALAVRTFAGGRASQLPALPMWIAATGAAGLAGLGLALHHGRRIARLEGRAADTAGALALLVALLLATADRLLYPRHYDAIHGALTGAGWALASAGAWLLVVRRLRRAPPAPALALAAAAGLVAALASLPSDHDGRAALLSPRAASARSVMLAVSPALYALPGERVDGAAVASARRRRRVPAQGGLPRWPDAHLVLVTIDALRADHLGAYGYGRRAPDGPLSPHLDGVAAAGVRFARAWTPTPRSSYAICSMMTGLALLPRGAPRAPTLAEALGDAGYYTAGFYPDGIFFHEGERLAAYRDAELGFARRDAEYRDADSRTDAALEELRDLRRRGEPRTFLWVHYFDVHEPYESRLLGDAPVDRYDGEIHETDAAIGRLLEGLRQLEREVVLIVSADHGEEHLDHGGRFHGGSLYEEQLRVPLILRAPGLAPRVVVTPVSLLDLAPTVRGALGLPSAPSDGYDLRPLALGRSVARPPLRATEEGMQAVLRWPHKLIEDEGEGSLMVFDLARDPGERASLASERPDIVAAILAELAAF